MEVGIVAEAQSTQRRPEHEASRAARTHASTMINSGQGGRPIGHRAAEGRPGRRIRPARARGGHRSLA
jgi:hypothetical protein